MESTVEAPLQTAEDPQKCVTCSPCHIHTNLPLPNPSEAMLFSYRQKSMKRLQGPTQSWNSLRDESQSPNKSIPVFISTLAIGQQRFNCTDEHLPPLFCHTHLTLDRVKQHTNKLNHLGQIHKF